MSKCHCGALSTLHPPPSTRHWHDNTLELEKSAGECGGRKKLEAANSDSMSRICVDYSTHQPPSPLAYLTQTHMCEAQLLPLLVNYLLINDETTVHTSHWSRVALCCSVDLVGRGRWGGEEGLECGDLTPSFPTISSTQCIFFPYTLTFVSHHSPHPLLTTIALPHETNYHVDQVEIGRADMQAGKPTCRQAGRQAGGQAMRHCPTKPTPLRLRCCANTASTAKSTAPHASTTHCLRLPSHLYFIHATDGITPLGSLYMRHLVMRST
ncbi:unnamed protein product [Hydatigera taeniaeformis]|uniref:Uncharacterized protein n=1 Tax=Hydatigena taeniaeformis TaxID=6205 RepID=A0A0R3X737_HYDTA|nr:unnamed protein product [Hydatigera taeniaeformis]